LRVSKSFPRSADRGLIEAIRAAEAFHIRPYFRDQLIAASLKLLSSLEYIVIERISAIS